jgi:hypothetical protein
MYFKLFDEGYDLLPVAFRVFSIFYRFINVVTDDPCLAF